jgi:hypothetical protein
VASGAARRNDPNDCFRFFLGIRMNNRKKQVRPPHGADCVPAFLTIFNSLNEQQAVRVLENERGGFKRDAVLCLVALVFVLVPLESHAPTIRNFRIAVNAAGDWLDRCHDATEDAHHV